MLVPKLSFMWITLHSLKAAKTLNRSKTSKVKELPVPCRFKVSRLYLPNEGSSASREPPLKVEPRTNRLRGWIVPSRYTRQSSMHCWKPVNGNNHWQGSHHNLGLELKDFGEKDWSLVGCVEIGDQGQLIQVSSFSSPGRCTACHNLWHNQLLSYSPAPWNWQVCKLG